MHSIYALHGFLGKPSDWNGVKNNLPAYMFNALPLQLPCKNRQSFDDWATQINSQATKDPRDKILMGYSLGGRLALHALIQQPKLWKAAILISTNTGLESKRDQMKRIIHDLIWAKRFKDGDWQKVVSDWNAQKVFSQSKPIAPQENEYDRKEISEQLLYWSLGMQKNFQQDLIQLPIPILWITGEHDTKFLTAAKQLQLAHPLSEKWVAPAAGHRVISDSPKALAEKIQHWLTNILDLTDKDYFTG